MKNAIMRIPAYKYSFNSGPVPEERLRGPIAKGNCRLLLQLYFYITRGTYFSPDELLNPNGYHNTGKFLKKDWDWSRSADFFDDLPEGAVIYGEKTTNKDGHPADYSEAAFPSYTDYNVRLHTAIYSRDFTNLMPLLTPETPRIGVHESAPAILHATSVQGMVSVWSLEKFMQHYKPVAAKQF